ncbi:hypothetical protein LXL04_011760 [Taraxacum kok-saghyz]
MKKRYCIKKNLQCDDGGLTGKMQLRGTWDLGVTYSRVSKRYHSSGTPTQKFTHLTKPTSKLPVPNTMGQKRSKIKC